MQGEMLPVLDLLVFSVAGKRFALRVGDVKRVVAAVKVTELPGAPAQVVGVVNVHGRILPVVDLGLLFGWPAREICPYHFLILAETAQYSLLLLVDAIHGVEQAVTQDMPSLTEDMPLFGGVVQMDDGVVLVYDLDAFLTQKDQDLLLAALSSR